MKQTQAELNGRAQRVRRLARGRLAQTTEIMLLWPGCHVFRAGAGRRKTALKRSSGLSGAIYF